MVTKTDAEGVHFIGRFIGRLISMELKKIAALKNYRGHDASKRIQDRLFDFKHIPIGQFGKRGMRLVLIPERHR